MKQISLIPANWKTQFTHGGVLRQKRSGRGIRPLSCKEPLHLVFKAHRASLREKSFRGRRSFPITQRIIRKYAKYFFVKVEQISIQGDHLHLLIRCGRRSQFHHFFRVTAGQIAQVFEKEGLLAVTDTPKLRKTEGVTDTPATQLQAQLWKHRPFSRVIRSYRALRIVKDYIQLNEKEAQGEIRYNSRRLRGISMVDWRVLWA